MDKKNEREIVYCTTKPHTKKEMKRHR